MSDIKKMTNNENVIFYNNDLEQLLAQSAEECESLGILHLASYEKYNKLSNIINIPVIILSSGIGFITGIDLNYDRMNIILGIGSVFVGIIKSIDSYFQLGKRAESHRMCALQYTQINKKIQIELSLCREQRQTAKDMLSIIKTDIKNLQDISPVIDQEIIKEYNLKYGKYKNVKKPNFVNGLTVVKVNANSLEQELASVARSIPHSIQSGAPSRPMSVMGDNNNYNGGGGGGAYNNFSDLNSNFVNLNDIAVNIPFSNFQNNANDNNKGSSVSVNSQPNSRMRSPTRATSTPVSASAKLVFSNANVNVNANASNAVTPIQTPASSSPISTLRLQQHNNNSEENRNNNAAVAVALPESTSSRLSTPQLLTQFQLPVNETGNEISLVIDIPDDNDDENGNSNMILSSGDSGLESSSPDSQVGNM
jgi:hypothetical protein